MYEKLASVKEIVDLMPREALGNAQAFLARQGYRVVQRTDESLTVARENKATPESTSLNLVVLAQPQPRGGVQIVVRGNDREGVQARQDDWKRWADGLPKKEGSDESGGESLLERQTEGQTTKMHVEEETSGVGGKGAARKPARRSVGAPRSTQAGPRRVDTAPGPTMYEYRMVQIPPTISVQASRHRGDEAAQYMESIANEHSEQGWEFYRVDTLSVAIPPGCLAALFGDKGSQSQYYVVTFRRPR